MREKRDHGNMEKTPCDIPEAAVYNDADTYVRLLHIQKTKWRRKKSHATTAVGRTTAARAAWVCAFTPPNKKAFKNSLKSLKWHFLEHARQTKLPLFSLFHYIISILHECKRHRVVYRYFSATPCTADMYIIHPYPHACAFCIKICNKLLFPHGIQ